MEANYSFFRLVGFFISNDLGGDKLARFIW